MFGHELVSSFKTRSYSHMWHICALANINTGLEIMSIYLSVAFCLVNWDHMDRRIVLAEQTLKSFDEHITSVTSSCLSSLSQINRVKHRLDRNTLLGVNSALVFSKLYYCSSVWSSTTKKNINKLQNVQNFAARIITHSQKFDHITPVLTELNS